MNYYPKKVQKSKPKKKIPQTDAIFTRLHLINQAADTEPTVLRLSMDAKARVKIGPFSRGGLNRAERAAVDHDFKPEATLTPFGIFLPQFDELFTYFTTSKVTSDFIVDCLERCWLCLRERFLHVKTLLLNQDNGPESHSRRTQLVKRLIDFSAKYKINLILAYCPSYHSKYNPVERCWGVLENHYHFELLDKITTAINFAQTMTWKGKHPQVELICADYPTGVKLSPKEMKVLETIFSRLPELGKWFVQISWTKAAKIHSQEDLNSC